MNQLTGMTGFGRAGDDAVWGSWTWEAKSVNGRGLDVRVNVPNGFEGLDQTVKKLAAARFSRGNLQISLRIEMAESQTVTVNQSVLDALCAEFEARTGGQPTEGGLATLMSARGVIDAGSNSTASLRALGQEDVVREILLKGAGQTLDQLEASRAHEGQALHQILAEALTQMGNHRREAELVSADQPDLLKQRLALKLQDIAADHSIDADRLMTEAALAAAKADVREELDRLGAHIETARNYLASGQAVGRKLDFLAQELNREANTLCAKSASLPLTNEGLALKTLIDQFKEQAANVE